MGVQNAVQLKASPKTLYAALRHTATRSLMPRSAAEIMLLCVLVRHGNLPHSSNNRGANHDSSVASLYSQPCQGWWTILVDAWDSMMPKLFEFMYPSFHSVACCDGGFSTYG